MRRLFYVLLLLILAIGLGLQIQSHPGYVRLVFGQWLLEAPLWLALIGLILLFTLFYAGLRLIREAGQLSERYRAWSRYRRLRQAQKQTNRGLIEYTEANWSLAERYLVHAAEASDTPLINYLVAAEAAQAQAAYDRRDQYLQAAYTSTEGAEIAVNLTQARLQLKQGQWEQCLATLRHLQSIAPHHPLVLNLLHSVYVNLKDWSSLLTLLPLLQKYKVLTPDAVHALYERIYVTQLQQQTLNASGGDALSTVWAGIPKIWQQNPAVLACYVHHLIQHSAHEEAEKWLLPVLKQRLDPALLALYADLESADAEKQLARAETWLKKQANEPALLFCVGMLSVRCQLWAKAEDYLKRYLKYAPSLKGYYALGQLYEQIAAPEKALAAYVEGCRWALAHAEDGSA